MIPTCPARDSGARLSVCMQHLFLFIPPLILMLRALRALVLASFDMGFLPLRKTHTLFPQKSSVLSSAFPSYSSSLQLLSVATRQGGVKV